MKFAKNFKYIKNLLIFAFKKRPLLYLSIVLSFASSGMEVLAVSSLFPLTELASKGIISDSNFFVRSIYFLGLEPNAKSLLLSMLLLFFLRILVNVIALGISFYLSKKIISDITLEAFSSIIKTYSIQEVESKSIGYFINLAGDEANRAGGIVMSFVQSLGLAVLATMYFVAICSQSYAMGFSVFVFLLVCFISLLGIFKKLNNLGILQIEQSRRSNSIFLDTLNGLRSVKAFSAEDYTISNYSQCLNEYILSLFKTDFYSLLSKNIPVLLLVSIISLAAVLFMGGATQVNLSFIITNVFLLLRFLPTIGSFLTIFNKIIADSQVGKNITEILHNSTKVKVGTESIDGTIDEILLKDLAFSYDGKKYVLNNLNLKFQKGKSYAVMGPSGIGKSTLFDLVLCFYENKNGSILINGKENQTIAPYLLREKIIVLGQQYSIFNDSILNNLKYGKEFSLVDIENISKLVCLEDFIMGCPQKYETKLNYQGSNLSGGQKQRIGLGRALLRKSDVLILDESTSALDTETKKKVVDNILKEYKNKIVIFVTHDSEVINMVNEVIDFKKINSATNFQNSKNII